MSLKARGDIQDLFDGNKRGEKKKEKKKEDAADIPRQG